MDYKEVPVGNRIEIQPKDPSYKPTLDPNSITLVSVQDCPIKICIKSEFGNITSFCKYKVTYGGMIGNKPILESVTCKYDPNRKDQEVTLLQVYSCPINKGGCISLEQDGKKQCEYLAGILPPIPSVRLHYCVVCNHPKESVGDI